jgi:pimeloyl-ACP methyl ester carboxylesterase
MRRALHCFVALALLAPLRARPAAESEKSTEVDARECVVLLHGVGLAGWVMAPLAHSLEAAGYRTLNLSYPSRTRPIEQLALEWLPAELRAAGVDHAPRVHFVAHSMGSLVTRLLLRDARPANLGRVVMLGPPNHGSAAADRARENAVLRWFMGVNLVALGTGPESITRRLGPADFDLGIIAGDRHLNPLFNTALGTTHDGAVTVDSARLDGARDFIVLPHSHTAMLWRRAVHAQVIAFLRDGRFQRSAAPADSK